MRISIILFLSFFIYENGLAQDTVMFVTKGKILIIDSLKFDITPTPHSHFYGMIRTNIRMIVELVTSILCTNRVVLNYRIKYCEKIPFVEGKRYVLVIKQYKLRDFEKKILTKTTLSHCNFIIALTDPSYMITSFEEE